MFECSYFGHLFAIRYALLRQSLYYYHYISKNKLRSQESECSNDSNASQDVANMSLNVLMEAARPKDSQTESIPNDNI